MEAWCALCNKRRENNEGSQTLWDKIRTDADIDFQSARWLVSVSLDTTSNDLFDRMEPPPRFTNSNDISATLPTGLCVVAALWT